MISRGCAAAAKTQPRFDYAMLHHLDRAAVGFVCLVALAPPLVDIQLRPAAIKGPVEYFVLEMNFEVSRRRGDAKTKGLCQNGKALAPKKNFSAL